MGGWDPLHGGHSATGTSCKLYCNSSLTIDSGLFLADSSINCSVVSELHLSREVGRQPCARGTLQSARAGHHIGVAKTSELNPLEEQFSRMERGMSERVAAWDKRMEGVDGTMLVAGAVPGASEHLYDQPQGFPISEQNRPVLGVPITEGENRGEQGFHPYGHDKIEFPIFSSGDPNPWIMRTDNYFELYEMPEWKKSGQLFEYIQEFERLYNRSDGWSDKQLRSTFIGGLRGDLMAELIMEKPTSVAEAIDWLGNSSSREIISECDNGMEEKREITVAKQGTQEKLLPPRGKFLSKRRRTIQMKKKATLRRASTRVVEDLLTGIGKFSLTFIP
ncbi:hypothetical protein ACLOJK_022344 [Asimina triloba]